MSVLEKIATQSEINKRIGQTYHQMFDQDSSDRIYFEIGDDEAYILDTGNNDVRTEGMSYGMMIAVQLNKKVIFSRLWKWVQRHMAAPAYDFENVGYFIWSCSIEGKFLGDGPAPDGEEFFAASLILAEKRWGNHEYGNAARRLLHVMVHKSELGVGEAMFDPNNKYIRYLPKMNLTDPSYHLPHFLDLFAENAYPDDKIFFLEAASASRKYLVNAADSRTGLTPEYSNYEGIPYNLNGHWTFFSDSYRTAANIGLDWSWSAIDEGQRVISLNIQRFFAPYLGKDIYKVPVFKISGEALTPEDQNEYGFPPLLVHHPIGLWSTLAQASLSTFELDEELATAWLKEFWNLPMRTGDYRYYDNLLYFFSLLSLSGHYVKEW